MIEYIDLSLPAIEHVQATIEMSVAVALPELVSANIACSVKSYSAMIYIPLVGI